MALQTASNFSKKAPAMIDASLIEKRFTNVQRSKTFTHLVRTYALDKKKVLDIGCSFGEFLKNFGPGSVGLSIDHTEVEYGTAHGLAIQYGNIESDDVNLPEKHFDVIYANNLFEHLFSPHSFLLKIKKYLKPEGMLILGVPCIPKIASLMHVKKFRGSLAVAHINFFTRETLERVVERAGWTVLSVRSHHFMNPFFDRLLNPIAPHFYVSATINSSFGYHEKRMKELAGYTGFDFSQ